MKRIFSLLVLLLAVLLTTAACQQRSKPNLQVYPVKVSQVKITDDGSFQVTGQTKAPRGALVLAEYQYPSSPQKHVDKAYPGARADYDKVAYPEVRGHHFKIILNANNELKNGQKLKVTIFAVAGYGNLLKAKRFSIVKIPKQILTKAEEQHVKSIKLKVTPAVVKRYPTVPVT